MHKLGSIRFPYRRLTALFVLLCTLSILAAALAPANGAAAMYLVTDDGYIQLQRQNAAQSIAVSAAVIGTGEDVRLTAGQGVDIVRSDSVLSLTAQDETVLSLLDRMDVPVGPMDMIAVDLSGRRARITVSSELIFYEKVSAVAAHSEVTVSDPFLAEGEEVLELQGHDGVRTEVYEVVCHRGEVSSRQLVDVLEEDVVDTVVRVGVSQDTPVTDIRAGAAGGGVLVLEDGTEIPYTEARAMRATAYSAEERGVGNITSTGTRVRVGTVAVDPKVIPYGTKMFIVTNDGQYIYGFGVAEDCGGAIKNDLIDLYFNTVNECRRFGRRSCTVYILED